MMYWRSFRERSIAYSASHIVTRNQALAVWCLADFKARAAAPQPWTQPTQSEGDEDVNGKCGAISGLPFSRIACYYALRDSRVETHAVAHALTAVLRKARKEYGFASEVRLHNPKRSCDVGCKLKLPCQGGVRQ